MRELTKSTLSAGLAMSLFGMQTMMNAFRRPQPGAPNSAQDAVDMVTQAMVDNTSGALREAFQAGDKVQRTLVDMTFQFMTLAPLRAGGSSASTMTDVTRQATERLRTWMGGMGGAGQPGCGCRGSAQPRTGGSAQPPPQPSTATTSGTGWGPMPGQT